MNESPTPKKFIEADLVRTFCSAHPSCGRSGSAVFDRRGVFISYRRQDSLPPDTEWRELLTKVVSGLKAPQPSQESFWSPFELDHFRPRDLCLIVSSCDKAPLIECGSFSAEPLPLPSPQGLDCKTWSGGSRENQHARDYALDRESINPGAYLKRLIDERAREKRAPTSNLEDAEEDEKQKFGPLRDILKKTVVVLGTSSTPSEAETTPPAQRPARYSFRVLRRLIRLLVNRILRMLLHRVCNGVAKLGASERHGASPSFMCQYLYPTPRAELA